MRGSGSAGDVKRRVAGQHGLAEMAGRPHLLAAGPRHRHVARRTLVEEQLGGLDDGLAVEALAEQPSQQHVGERGHRHALVMRHVGSAPPPPSRLRAGASA